MSKLEKALELAKKSRNRGGASDTGIFEEVSTGTGAVMESGPTTAPISPEYTRTKVMTIDNDTISQKGVALPNFNSSIIEQYNVLRAKLDKIIAKNKYKVILVASPGEDEGKTLTAINLALSFAREAHRTVLLIDGDMRKPEVDKFFGLPVEHGLYEHLTTGWPLEDLLINPGIPRLTILPAGRPKEPPADLLNGPAMRAFIKDIKSRYPERIIIFDSPPLLQFSDGIYLSDYADTILMVTCSGKTRAEDLRHALEMVDNRPLAGVVLNRAKLDYCMSSEYY